MRSVDLQRAAPSVRSRTAAAPETRGLLTPAGLYPPTPPVREGLFVPKLEFSSCLIRYCPNDPELLGLTQLAFLIKLVFLVNETCWGIYLTHFCVSIAVVPASGWTTSVSHCFVY